VFEQALVLIAAACPHDSRKFVSQHRQGRNGRVRSLWTLTSHSILSSSEVDADTRRVNLKLTRAQGTAGQQVFNDAEASWIHLWKSKNFSTLRGCEDLTEQE
jgi:hypothetical protein